MSFDVPAIVKQASRVLRDVEAAVRGFARYHKYSVGERMRNQAWDAAVATHRVWRAKRDRGVEMERLVQAVDDLKLGLQLAKEVHAFKSFAQFEALAREVNDLGRQCGGWAKDQQGKGQDAPLKQSSAQRPKTLSSRDASCGPNL